jgi:hypothetical protein
VAFKGKNYYTKDYDGLKLVLDTGAPKDAAHPWNAGYTLLLKSFTDSLFVNSDGTLDPGKLRADQLHKLDFDVKGPLGASLSWSVTGGLDLNVSNQGFFDPTELKFNEDFYGYMAETLGGSLNWFPRGPEGPSLSPGYTGTLRQYSGRLIRNPGGAFTQGKQADTEHKLSLNGRWPLRPWAALTAGLDYESVQSNQAFVQRMRNTYDIQRARLGADLRY